MARTRSDPEADFPRRARAAQAFEKPRKNRQRTHHHPVIAISLIFMAACAAQIAVWLVNLRLASRVAGTTGLLVHDTLYDYIRACLLHQGSDEQLPVLLFLTSMTCALLSGAAWYGLTRLSLGPSWALWTSILWVIHPGFAFLAQRPGPMVLVMLLTPTSLAILAWWYRTRRAAIACLGGMVMGLLALTAVQAFALLPAALIAILATRYSPRTRARALVAFTSGFALILAAFLSVFPTRERQAYIQRHRTVLQHQAVSTATSAPATVSAERGLAYHASTRMVACLYATADAKLERPLLVLEIALLIPAAWGGIVAWRYRPWRWILLLYSLFGGTFWICAAIVEPLARNLMPVGGCAILFALVGMADIYERIFGRRLTEPTPDGKSLHASDSTTIM